MKGNKVFGKYIRSLRKQKNISLEDMAKELSISQSYLSKLENGKKRPSEKVLDEIIGYFNIQKNETEALLKLLDYKRVTEADHTAAEKLSSVNRKKIPEERLLAGRTILPKDLNVLFADSVLVTSGPNGIVCDYMQNMGNTNQRIIVARIGMTENHVRRFLKVLKKAVS